MVRANNTLSPLGAWPLQQKDASQCGRSAKPGSSVSPATLGGGQVSLDEGELESEI